ncbi:MAG TPA: twin-arginine translocase TatA/TatE family subunit [Clostridiales bacterium UBA8153]|nr:twin-arginine translocase TatA/TatE family subunit [Clostridiales bacterium UBA8153]
MQLGTMELLVILIVALIFVGPAKLPELGRALGRGLREFRELSSSLQRQLEESGEKRREEEERQDRGDG